MPPIVREFKLYNNKKIKNFCQALFICFSLFFSIFLLPHRQYSTEAPIYQIQKSLFRQRTKKVIFF